MSMSGSRVRSAPRNAGIAGVDDPRFRGRGADRLERLAQGGPECRGSSPMGGVVRADDHHDNVGPGDERLVLLGPWLERAGELPRERGTRRVRRRPP